MFSGLFLTVLLKMFSCCWAKCVPLKAYAVKNSSSVSVTAVISVSTTGGGDSVFRAWGEFFVACSVNEYHWPSAVLGPISAGVRLWRQKKNVLSWPLLMSLLQSHCILVLLFASKSNQKALVLAPFPKPIEVFIRIRVQGTSLMFAKF